MSSDPTVQKLFAELPPDVVGLAAAGALLVLAVLLRRVALPGVVEGLVVCAVNAALIPAYLSRPDAQTWQVRLASVLTAMCILWWIVAGWIEPAGSRPSGASLHGAIGLRRAIASAAALTSAVVAVATLLAYPLGGSRGSRVTVCVLISGLVMPPAWAWLRHKRADAGLACAALAACVLWLLRPAGWEDARGPMAAGAAALAGVALLWVLLLVRQGWSLRRRLWMTAPDHLADPPAPASRTQGMILTLCTASGITAAAAAPAPAAPAALLLAALAAFGIFHLQRRGPDGVGALGLLLLGLAVVSADLAWLPRSDLSAARGLLVAGIYMLWLARFWSQQLLDGRPWTTTGRLVPMARNLGVLAAPAALVMVLTIAFAEAPPANLGAASAIVAAASALLFSLMLARDAIRHDSPLAALSAVMAGTTAAVIMGLSFDDPPIPSLLTGGAAALAALLLAARSRGDARAGLPFGIIVAHVIVILPAGALLMVFLDVHSAFRWPVVGILMLSVLCNTVLLRSRKPVLR